MTTFRRRAAALGLAASFGAGAAGAGTEPPPIGAFFDGDDIAQLVLSPDGRSFALLARAGGAHLRLVVGDTSDPAARTHVVASYVDGDVHSVRWVNDQRLLFARSSIPGLTAIDKDGTEATVVVGNSMTRLESTHIKPRTLTMNHRLLTVLRDGSSDIVLAHEVLHRDYDLGELRFFKSEGVVPVRVDTRGLTQHEIPLPADLSGVASAWFVDTWGRPRVAMTQREGVRKVWMPEPGAAPDAPWRTIHVTPSYGSVQGDFRPIDVGPDGQVLVESFSGDTRGLFELGPDRRPRTEPIVRIPGFDFEGILVWDEGRRRLAGVQYVDGGVGTTWLEPSMHAVQARVDAHLPGLVNLVTPAECGCSDIYAVRAFSDRQPTSYYLFDAAHDRLVALGASRPAIDAAAMSRTEFHRFKARDGLEIPAWVTQPAGAGPWPAVVLLHGGPYQRGGEWPWQAERQFLASRGYLVVEPEFRGSDGYGARLLEAGFKQWGRAMQDDVADATRWAIHSGWADASRVCLMGASYGGYATLMGLARYGELYRCGVATAAPTDLVGLRDIWWSDVPDEWRGVGLSTLVGDPVKDGDAMRANSPVNLAERIDRPLLLVHGFEDRRVPIEHARRMLSALKSAGKDVEWIEFPHEGHGIRGSADTLLYYQRVEAFLARHLAPPPTPAPTAAEASSAGR